ncbi:amino acid transporter [Magnaporthiopsis poae ATCC 64411]|uniref:Amino acid transporter n=1 Tax=Magnaporthiopsis poae (strain ATCC 64411 / 73-15) TaxID=644358 RepID=A0A0C4E886_MAGP6|nr:amino acid transporter [Magnaporthiopsis poae ATCC 64411]
MADSRWDAQRGTAADAKAEKSSVDRTADGENSGSDTNTNRWPDDGVIPAGEMYDASGNSGKEGDVTAPVTTGNIFSEGGRDYRTMGRWDATLVLITNQVGLGILALPAVVRVLGIVPAVIAIIGIGLLSTYTAYELLQFYRRHPHVVNLVDMARLVGGRPLETAMGASLVFDLILTCGSMSVTLSVAFNTITEHALCTTGFMGISAFVCFLLCLPRNLHFVARVGIPATISIVSAVFIVIISLGVADRPQNAPPEWTRANDVKMFAVGFPNFRDGMNACLNVAFAYAGNVGFVSYMAEMKDPSRDFMFAAWALQAFTIPLYIIAAVTIYGLAGDYVTSPSLGSAPVIPAKVAYAVALPCVFASGCVFGHTGIKYMYVVAMKRLGATSELTSRTARSWLVWVGCAAVFWVLAYLLANAIPIFESILSIASATFIAWFTFGFSAVLWFNMFWGREMLTGWRKISLTVVNALIIAMTLFMNSAGLWSAAMGLQDVFNNPENSINAPFTCADNSIF